MHPFNISNHRIYRVLLFYPFIFVSVSILWFMVRVQQKLWTDTTDTNIDSMICKDMKFWIKKYVLIVLKRCVFFFSEKEISRYLITLISIHLTSKIPMVSNVISSRLIWHSSMLIVLNVLIGIMQFYINKLLIKIIVCKLNYTKIIDKSLHNYKKNFFVIAHFKKAIRFYQNFCIFFLKTIAYNI